MAGLTEEETMPDCLQDFHDAKDLFKALWRSCVSDEDKKDYLFRGLNWQSTMVFTMDKFLWFMAQHGYVLRRSRHQREFRDLAATIEADREASGEALRKLLAATDEE